MAIAPEFYIAVRKLLPREWRAELFDGGSKIAVGSVQDGKRGAIRYTPPAGITADAAAEEIKSILDTWHRLPRR